jgi:hypothetical protein
MANDSPAAIIYSSDGYEATVKNAVAIPTGTPALIAAGSDGTNSRYITVDTSGRPVVVGAGTAGAGAGGLITIQGDPAGTPVPVSGTVTVNGTVTVTQSTPANLLANVGGLGASGAALVGNPVRIGASDGANTRDLISDASGRLIVIGAAANGAAATGNPVLMAGSDGTNARTLKTTNNGTLFVSSTPTVSTTATTSNVSASASNVTLLTTNAARLGATIYNDSSKVMYLKLGTTASTTSYTTQLFGQGYYEVPANYVGQIDAIWNGASGAARITELT